MSCRTLSFIFHFKHMCLHQRLCIKYGCIYSLIHITNISECVPCRDCTRGSGYKRRQDTYPALKEYEVHAGCNILRRVSLTGQHPFPNVQMWFPELDTILLLHDKDTLLPRILIIYIILRKCSGVVM